MDTILDRIIADPTIIEAFTADEIAEAREAIATLATEIEAADADLDEALAADLTEFADKLTARETALTEAAEGRAGRLAGVREKLGVVAEEAEETPEEETVETETAEVEEVEAVAASAETPEERRARFDRARASIPAAQAADTIDVTEDRGATIVASYGPRQGTDVTLEEFAALMAEQHRIVGSASEFRQPLGTLQSRQSHAVTASGDFTSALTDMWADWYAPDAVVAALCAPGDITYDIVEVGSVNGILRLPTMNAPRGALSFFPASSPLDLASTTTVADGLLYEWCSAEDNPKPQYTHDCPDAVDCTLCAYVIQHVFNNFHGKFHAESVANILRQSAILAERRLNYQRIAAVIAMSNTVSVTVHDEGGGALVQGVRALASNAAGFRQANALDRRTPVDVALPVWLPDAWAADAIARGSTVDYQSVVSKVEATLGQFGIRTQWVNDLDPTNGVDFNATTDALMWGPGGPFELDGGDINVGTYRDSTLNAANQYATFFEYTRSWCSGGIPARHIEGIPACATGAVGDYETIECGSSSSA